MINKILIAEDIDSINTGIITILQDKFDFSIEHANSCDKAYLKILKAIQENNPFDLLITDLSFKADGFLENKLNHGEDLINAIKEQNITIRTLVYTIEDKPSLIKRLKEILHVDGIVLKGQNSLSELCLAIDAINKDENYFTSEVQYILKNDSTIAIDSYDITLLSLLSEGLTQHEISDALKKEQIKPSSISSIEKRIGELKTTLKANNSIHMISIAKDMCLI